MTEVYNYNGKAYTSVPDILGVNPELNISGYYLELCIHDGIAYIAVIPNES